MNQFPDIGYTPENLYHAIDVLGWSQKQLSEFIGKSERTLRQWLHKDLESKSHADMPLVLWRKLLKKIKELDLEARIETQ